MTVSRLVIIDYGMGNLGSVRNAMSCLGQAAEISSDPAVMAEADAFVLPGVGAFGEAMARLKAMDLVSPLTEFVVSQGKPLLGICLGMQLLAEESREHGHHRGLGWIRGTVEPISPAKGIRVPHVGWSETSIESGDTLFANIDAKTCFYFDHSYQLDCSKEIVSATTHYGATITAAIRSGNIVATQFHPEKSQRAGLKLIRNFLNMAGELDRGGA
jgi:glutamine amidotransferase